MYHHMRFYFSFKLKIDKQKSRKLEDFIFNDVLISNLTMPLKSIFSCKESKVMNSCFY